MTQHQRWMERALALAAQGLNSTRPNPRVGAVVVRQGQVVGEGYHHRAGQPHAEIHALQQAGELARGASLYVNLEPCCHVGRTGPCVEAIIKAGIKQVVWAMSDPNPLVSGRGFERLGAAGIELIGPLAEAEALELNRGFVQRMKFQRPWLRLKSALSLDGRIALANGQSQWLSSPQALAQVQLWRARSCVIVSTASTVLADNPQLNARDATGQALEPQPALVLLDRQMRLSPSLRVFDTRRQLIVVTEAKHQAQAQTLVAAGAQLWLIPPEAEADSLAWLWRRMALELEANEVWIEAGGQFSSFMLEQGELDEWVVHGAPLLLGADAHNLYRQMSPPSLDQAARWHLERVQQLGQSWELVLGRRH